MARGNSSVEAWENSSVVARENSSVVARGNSSVVANANARVTDATRTHKIKTSGNARIVYNPKTALEYAEYHGMEHDDVTVKLYKAVHKRDGRYFSDNDSSFEYVIGQETKADKLDTDPTNDCGHGIHAAHKAWCVDYGRGWKDLAILEVEMLLDGMIVPVDNPDKVRAASVKVLREVPLDECGMMGKIMAKQRGNDDGNF